MMSSPLEAAIDKACGFDRAKWLASRVTLRCGKCGVVRSVERHHTDPVNATTVEHLCNDCRPADSNEPPKYFDKDGQPVAPEWA